MWMRGGTSKGGYFLAEDLPADADARNAALLAIMGSPDAKQIDGMGGADPLTSKVAVVKRSERDDADVDYLFLQVVVDLAIVSDAQNCGNILAGVGPFAIERGLVNISGDTTDVRIYMENTGQIATASVNTAGGYVHYTGTASIDGVPGTAAAVPIEFKDTAGSSCGALLPSGNARDTVLGVDVTCIDNGMPVVVLNASDFGIRGDETREALDDNSELKAKLEAIRLAVGPLMNLGDVSDKTVPKMSLVSPALKGGVINTRTFIPHRCHATIGVLGAVSVATACAIEGSVAAEVASVTMAPQMTLAVEHPSGEMTVVLSTENNQIKRAALLRTARKLMDGSVFYAA
ncbi:MAG: 4-oxalomesaconate tautomerase [Gammaproteobacteria bacterium]|nr:4-oxalomesaconate tautomerase [Gammaproteobacteria bacterium]